MERRTFAFDAFGLYSVYVFVQISEGSQHKEQVDSLFLTALNMRIVQGIFVLYAQCHGEFTKKHLLKDEVY